MAFGLLILEHALSDSLQSVEFDNEMIRVDDGYGSKQSKYENITRTSVPARLSQPSEPTRDLANTAIDPMFGTARGLR